MIYVAAPYSSPDATVVAQRMKAFSEVMASMIEQGEYPVSPLLNHFLTERVKTNFPLDWAFWHGYSKTLLEKCDALLVIKLPGWEESSGVQGEIAIATARGIPVRYLEWQI